MVGNYRPQIFSNTNVATSYISPAGSRNAAMIGSAIWGPLNTVTSISNLSNFVNIFGDDKTGTGVTGIKGAKEFFANGGTLKFTRIEDGDAVSSEYLAQNGIVDVLTFTAKYKGTYGDNISIVCEAVDTTNRKITITDGRVTEVFSNGIIGHATNSSLATEVNASSTLITITVEAGHETTELLDVFTSTQLSGGDDGEDTLSNVDYETAFDDLLIQEDYSFLLTPGQSGDTLHSSLAGRLNSRATTEKKYSRYISGVTTNETIATIGARTTSSKRFTRVAPSIYATHRIDGTTLTLDGSYLACAYAGMLCVLDIEEAATHKPLVVEGVVVNTTTGQLYYNKVEQNDLLSVNTVPVTKISTYVGASRGVTTISDKTSVFYDGVIVDIVDYVQAEIEDYLNSVIGKPKTDLNKNLWAARVDSILANLKINGIINNYVETSVTDAASPDTINVAVGIQPSYPVNFIYLNITVNG